MLYQLEDVASLETLSDDAESVCEVVEERIFVTEDVWIV